MTKAKKNLLLFGIVTAVWVALDIASKAHFAHYYEQGEVITGPILGLFRLHLIHNTGAAWGIFGNSTFALGIVSCVVCTALIVAVCIFAKRLSKGELLGLGLVLAGGLGNAIDRFMFGYVRDFIEFTFISFPIFNIADMGVTCGIVIFFVSYLYRERTNLFSKKEDVSNTQSE